MFSNGVLLLAFTLFVSSLSTQAQISTSSASIESANSSSSDLFFLCKRDRVIRWLRAYKLDNGKCKALYSKEGYLQVVSSATFFASCEGVLLSVKKNLEEGNFRCTQMANASVIELESN